MKALVGIAVALGLAGTALGVALVGKDAFNESTLELTGGKPEQRTAYRAEGIAKNHPNGILVEVRSSTVTGDRTGEYLRTCIPIPDDDIECNGAFRLSDGTIEIETTEQDDPGETTAVAAIVGGTGAYEGALGSVDVDFEKHIYTLHLLVPEQ